MSKRRTSSCKMIWNTVAQAKVMKIPLQLVEVKKLYQMRPNNQISQIRSENCSNRILIRLYQLPLKHLSWPKKIQTTLSRKRRQSKTQIFQVQIQETLVIIARQRSRNLIRQMHQDWGKSHHKLKSASQLRRSRCEESLSHQWWSVREDLRKLTMMM